MDCYFKCFLSIFVIAILSGCGSGKNSTQEPNAQTSSNEGHSSSEAVKGEDYTTFDALPDDQKLKIVWQLHTDRKWGRPDQKPICRYLLATQAKSSANATAWTDGAIELAEREKWDDMASLIQQIYQRPSDIWIYERAFRYVRSQASRPIPPDVISSTETLERSGRYQSTVTDDEVQAAKQRLLSSSDKEAVLVYTIGVAGWHSGKGGTDRGRKAAVEVIRQLDKEAVRARLQQLFDDSPGHVKSEIRWIAKCLGMEMKPSRAPDQAEPVDGK